MRGAVIRLDHQNHSDLTQKTLINEDQLPGDPIGACPDDNPRTYNYRYDNQAFMIKNTKQLYFYV